MASRTDDPGGPQQEIIGRTARRRQAALPKGREELREARLAVVLEGKEVEEEREWGARRDCPRDGGVREAPAGSCRARWEELPMASTNARSRRAPANHHRVHVRAPAEIVNECPPWVGNTPRGRAASGELLEDLDRLADPSGPEWIAATRIARRGDRRRPLRPGRSDRRGRIARPRPGHRIPGLHTR